MKRFALIPLLIAAILLSGCQDTQETSPAEVASSTAATFQTHATEVAPPPVLDLSLIHI